RKSDTHGPVGLTRTRAANISSLPVSRSRGTIRHAPLALSAEAQRGRVRMRAQGAGGARAVSAAGRASTTQQSEYSNALSNPLLSNRPVSLAAKSRMGRLGGKARPPR